MTNEAFDEQILSTPALCAPEAKPQLATDPASALTDSDLIRRLHERYKQNMPQLYDQLEQLLGMSITQFNSRAQQLFAKFAAAVEAAAQNCAEQRLKRPGGQSIDPEQLDYANLEKTKLKEQTSWAYRHIREILQANAAPAWIIQQWPEDEPELPTLLQRFRHTLHSIRQCIRHESGPFEVMLHGPGSSGKSSLINAMCGSIDWDRFPLAWGRLIADDCAIGHFPHTAFPVTDNVGNLPLFYRISNQRPDPAIYRQISYNPFLEQGLCDNAGLHNTCLPSAVERQISLLKDQFGIRYYVANDDRLDKIVIEVSNTAEGVNRSFLLQQIHLIDTAGVSEKQLINSDYFTEALYPRIPNDRIAATKKADFLLYVGKLISNQQEEVIEQQRWVHIDARQVHKRQNWEQCPEVLRSSFSAAALYVLNQADIFVADSRQVKREISPNDPGDRQTIKRLRQTQPYVLASPYTFMTLGSDQIQGFRTFCEGGTTTHAGKTASCDGFGQHDDGAGGIITIWAELGKAYLKPLQSFIDIDSSSGDNSWLGLRCQRISALQHWHGLLLETMAETLQPVENWRQDRVLLELIEEVMYLALHRHYFHGDNINQLIDSGFADFHGEPISPGSAWIKHQWCQRTGFPGEDIPEIAAKDRRRLSKAVAFVALDRDRMQNMLFDPTVPRHNDIFPPVWAWEERLEQHQRKTQRGRKLPC